MLRRVAYESISAARIDEKGALRLFRRRRLILRQDVYHPAGEWLDVELRSDREAVVILGSRVERDRAEATTTETLRALDPRGERHLRVP